MSLKIEGRYHLGTMQLTNSTKLEFNIVKHDGKEFIDIRTWFANIYQGGAWTPTKKGVHFPLESFQLFLKELERVKTYDPQELKADDAPIEA
jgi:hypothetical protein